LPRRWVVERTLSWCGQSRRLSKDYERLCATSEALIYALMIRLMLRRLAHT
jgi:putative transposase